MPTETGTAFLVDPMGHAPKTLSEREYETIRRYLNMPNGAACQAVEWLLRVAETEPKMNDKEVLDRSLTRYGNERPGECTGLLARIFGESAIEDLTTRETETLQETLIAIRAGGWFAEWLALQVKIIATGNMPDDCYPAPLKIAASLGACVEEYEETMEAAREVVRMRPDLLQSHMPIYPIREATPEPHAAPETTTRPASKPTNAQRTRKARNKVPMLELENILILAAVVLIAAAFTIAFGHPRPRTRRRRVHV
jgi:hypothetical protein